MELQSLDGKVAIVTGEGPEIEMAAARVRVRLTGHRVDWLQLSRDER